MMTVWPTSGQFGRTTAATLLALATPAGCDQRNSYVPPPPPKVTVAQPAKSMVTLYLEATGNSAAVNTANLVARVPGFIEKINYQDGALVKKGTLLFTIEPESYDLKLKQSQAMEEAARSTVTQTEADFQRQQNLVQSNAVSQSAFDASRASRDTARGNLTQNEINTKLAAINYGYTSVTAPFDGIVTARQVSVGDYVGGSSTPTVLASIVQLDPIYVNFNIDEQNVLRIREQIRGRYLLIVGKDNVVEQRKVEVGPRDGTLRVIEKGLAPDDRVVVAGLLRAIPGQKVEPHEATSSPAAH